MKAVVNTTPLVALAQIRCLDLLDRLFDQVVVPEVVYQECTVDLALPGALEIQSARWLERHSLPAASTWHHQLLGLDPGELDVLRLAQEIHPDWVIIDEKLGRRVAQSLGFQVKGTLGILLVAYQEKLISQPQAVLAAEQLQLSSVRVNRPLWDWFLRQL